MKDKKDIIGWILITLSIVCLVVVFLVNGGDFRKLLTINNFGMNTTAQTQTNTVNKSQNVVNRTSIDGQIGSNIIDDKKTTGDNQNQQSGTGTMGMIGGEGYVQQAVENSFGNSVIEIAITFAGVILAFVFGMIGLALIKTQNKKG